MNSSYDIPEGPTKQMADLSPFAADETQPDSDVSDLLLFANHTKTQPKSESPYDVLYWKAYAVIFWRHDKMMVGDNYDIPTEEDIEKMRIQVTEVKMSEAHNALQFEPCFFVPCPEKNLSELYPPQNGAKLAPLKMVYEPELQKLLEEDEKSGDYFHLTRQNVQHYRSQLHLRRVDTHKGLGDRESSIDNLLTRTYWR